MARARSRYELIVKLASGGMATVYVGRVRGPLGFSRLVAIKRAHPHLLEDDAFVRMLVDEAKLASRIHHPHVVAVLDIERDKKSKGPPDLRLVMEYVEGASLADLVHLADAAARPIPPAVALRIALDVCAGLQVAHELTDESGAPLGLVHRDVSPHNILVGVDGLSRISDFGIAKATSRPSPTTTGSLKGKLAYMAPEYVSGEAIDARADVFALGVVVWEALARQKLFRGSSDVETIQRVASAEVPPLSSVVPDVGAALDEVVALALARAPENRFSSARAFGNALEAEARSANLLASHAEVAALVRELAKEQLEARRELIRDRVSELDAQITASSTQESLKAASEAAQKIVAASALALPSGGATPTPGVDATLDGSGVTSAPARAASSTPSVPRKRGALRWLALAALGGAAAAIVSLLVVGPRGGAATGDKTSAEPAPSVTAPIAPTATPAPASASAPPSVTVSPSTGQVAPPPNVAPGKPTGAPQRGVAPAARDPAETIAPNPYGTKR
jgi:serine/threonine-protein kinase